MIYYSGFTAEVNICGHLGQTNCKEFYSIRKKYQYTTVKYLYINSKFDYDNPGAEPIYEIKENMEEEHKQQQEQEQEQMMIESENAIEIKTNKKISEPVRVKTRYSQRVPIPKQDSVYITGSYTPEIINHLKSNGLDMAMIDDLKENFNLVNLKN